MHLIVRPPHTPHPAQDAVDEFDAAIAADPRVRLAAWEGLPQKAGYYAAAALFRYGGRRGLRLVPVIPKGRRLRVNRQYFAVVMGRERFAKCLPHFLLPARKAIYLFDAWPPVQDRVVAFVNKFELDYVFVSASQAADAVGRRVAASVHWMPEGIDPTPYRHRPLAQKDIDVVQIGRKYDAHHERIAGALARRGKTYLYEKKKGEIVFPTKEDLIEGFARSKVSICVPSSITHPERAGGVETMTLRYLQSMVSKCLIVGHAPAEMVRLFGYNPVVEIDEAAPVGQLLDVLDHMERYADLIERNHRAVLEAHTWHHRWRSIAAVLFGEGGFSPS